MPPSSKPLHFLFLYTRLPDYFLQCIRHLLTTCPPGSKAWMVHYDADKDAPYRHEQANKDIVFINKSDFDESLIESQIKPDIIYITGWGDKQYRQITQNLRQKVPVVMGIDNPWLGTWKQRIACFLAPFMVKNICTTVWVAGIPQYEFARRLGFTTDQIIKGLYCADLQPLLKQEKPDFPKRIVFTGRLVAYKRPDWLLRAFLEILQQHPELADWKLTIIGTGPLIEELQTQSKANTQIEFVDFLPPAEVRKQYSRAAVFCLPSHHEHWGVVVQEAAAAGLPLLLSNNCGAASAFLIHGHNGFLFNSNDYHDFREKLAGLMKKNETELQEMGKASRLLAGRITHETWAASFKSVIVDKD